MSAKVRLGLSNQRHLPVWKVFDWTFALWDFGGLRRTQKQIEEVSLAKEDGVYRAKYNGFDLRLLRFQAVCLVRERQMWENYYAPVDVKGKTVLDVGLGCLETAAFYLGKGATKVVGVEINPDAARLAKENMRANPQMNVELLNEPFSLEHLKIPHDFLKMDVEGAESVLLGYGGKLGPCVIEAHKIGLWDIPKALKEKFPYLKQVYTGADPAMPVELLQGT